STTEGCSSLSGTSRPPKPRSDTTPCWTTSPWPHNLNQMASGNPGAVHRNGLVVDGRVTQASGTAEREAALTMLDRRKRRRRITLGADKAYDVRQFVEDLRKRSVTPHIAIDGHLSKTVQ